MLESSESPSGRSAVVLLSGGADSATVLAIARSLGFRIFGLTFDYGQRNFIEVHAAKCIAETGGVEEHILFPVPLSMLSDAALLGHGQMPEVSGAQGRGRNLTYVPARNTVFLAIALAWCESVSASAIFIGSNKDDYRDYPDCRPEYFEQYEKLLNLATKDSGYGCVEVKIYAPLVGMTKAEVIRSGLLLGVDYSLTVSCYGPHDDGLACGLCDACVLRLNAFREAGVKDPVKYRERRNSSPPPRLVAAVGKRGLGGKGCHPPEKA